MKLDFKDYIDLDYKLFSEKLIPDSKILGIRSTNLKKIAKYNVDNNIDYFNENYIYHEEIMIYMYMLSYMKDINLIYNKLDNIVPQFINWAQVDSLLNIKIIKKNRDYFLPLIYKYRYSSNTFEVRFALIMLLSHYMDENYLDLIFETINNIKIDSYYANMAASWLIAECFIKFRDYTLNKFKNLKVNKFIFNKSISKICDSYRVTNADKEYLKSLRKK
jgi:3-methyladenine DNA glycosylase AlkD